MSPAKEGEGWVRFRGPGTSINLVFAPKEKINLSVMLALLEGSKVGNRGPGVDSLQRVSVNEVQEELLTRLT